MNEIRVCLHRSRYRSKPNKSEINTIRNELAEAKRSISRDAIKSFVKMVGEEGRCFSPATFKTRFNDSSMSADNFIQLQLLVLDFCNGTMFEEVMGAAELYDLPILFAYEPFSDDYRFRVVFLNDVPVTDLGIAAAMQRALMTIFPNADPVSQKVLRLYLGGKKLLYFDPSIPEINIESLFRSMSFYLKDRDGDTNYKRKIIEFSRDTGIRLNRSNLLDVTIINRIYDCNNDIDNNSPSTIILSNTIGEKLSRSYQINLRDDSSSPSIIRERASIHRPYRSGDLKKIESICRLYQEFQSGTKILSSDELLGLATNLVQIESGTARFKSILKSNAYFDDRPKKYSSWDYSLFYIRGYTHFSCEGFCPYKNSCVHADSIISTTKPQMERLTNYVEVFHPREEVEKDVEQAIFNAHRTHGIMMQVIKAQTSSGKTTSYKKLVEANPSERFIIAAPTNLLKDQVFDDMMKMGLNVIKTPSLEAIKEEMPEKVRRHIAHLYRIGRHRMVHPYIIETVKKKDIPCLREYLEDRERLKSFDGSVITTHRYLLNMDEKKLKEFDTTIIDEDIIFKSIVSNQGQITIADLNNLLESASDARLIKKIAALIKRFESDAGPTIELPGFEWDDDDDGVEGMSTPFDIPSFCLATHFYCRRASNEMNLEEDTVTFLKPVTFYDSVKYIMVSATVDEGICRKYFGDKNVSFYECKKAKYEGILNQYHGRSMSRSSIDASPGIIKRIMEMFEIKELPITHKKFDAGPLRFGNSEGSNMYEGKDILVIGTPYHAEFIYKLFVFSIGIDFDEDEEMKSCIATHNGYRFPFTTYDDEELRAIHFWMLESELEQAVGRARLLRHPCTVYLFSNFPLCQAVMKNDKYWKL